MSDEETTVRLLRAAGARAVVSDERTARVRAGVRAGWQKRIQRRAMRRRAAFVIAAVVCGVAGVAVLDRADRRAPDAAIAVVERIEGTSQRLTNARPQNLSPKEAVRVGDLISTDADARVALRFNNGTSVRLDARSQARLTASNAMELLAGGVYVDSGRNEGQFEVRTPMGTARDIGTQFEVRLVEKGLRIRVRTGVVELSHGRESVLGGAGTEIMMAAGGAVTRAISAYGSDWEWAARLSPRIEMEGASLASFLESVAHEQGWTVHYADPSLERRAAGIVLHGSVADLSPSQMVEVAIATSGFEHRLDRGELTVLRGRADR